MALSRFDALVLGTVVPTTHHVMIPRVTPSDSDMLD
jgi:hypothetical protein